MTEDTNSSASSKKKPKPIVTSEDGLLGACQATGKKNKDGKHVCGKQGSLREISGYLTKGNAILCDRHAAQFENTEFRVRTIKAGEIRGL